jgi:hypothetical protein
MQRKLQKANFGGGTMQSVKPISLLALQFFLDSVKSAQSKLDRIQHDPALVGTESQANLNMASGYIDKAIEDLNEMIVIAKMQAER